MITRHRAGGRLALAAAAAWAAVTTGLPAHGQQNAAPVRSGIDKSTFDTTVRPQDDFFRYVNGGWLKTSEIPSDRPADGGFYKLRDEAEANLKALIEQAAAGNAPANSEARKIGDIYNSFLDEKTVETLGLKPIAGLFQQIAALQDKNDLAGLIGQFARLGISGPFGLYVGQDEKKADEMIVYLNQGGIGLPDEAYYRDPKYAKIREAYVAHIAKQFEQAGLPHPAEAAQKVMALETQLAASHLDRVSNRDREKTYNKKGVAGLQSMTPSFPWMAFAEAYKAPHVSEVIIGQPKYFEAFNKAFEEVPLDDWKAWMNWKVIRTTAPYLNKAMADESFNFYSKTLNGVPEQRPRWKRAVDLVEGALGEALGKVYVEKHFPPVAKARMQELVKNLTEAYRESINGLAWMSDDTRKKAIDKLNKFTPKIGYPDKWRDFSGLVVKPDDLLGNVFRSNAFDLDYMLNKLGKPVDRLEWAMTPQTVNAYYNPTMNEIVFPAAILQPPFFDANADDAANYGGIGAVIGHEIGHGFDDQGSKSDGDGNLTNWCTETDRAEFEKRTGKLIAQYGAFEPAQLPGEKVNGELTIGENIGDLGGLTIAYKAYLRSLNGKPAPVLDGLTGPQRFFVGFGQIWRVKFRDAALRQRLATDPHSPGEFRCNGPLSNFSAFYETFDLKPTDKLYRAPENRVSIW